MLPIENVENEAIGTLDVFYLNTIEQLFQFVEQQDQ